MPEISVIVPVYKAERFLPHCLDSILNQTFRDFEVLLVDDGSPDRCGQICLDYAGQDGRITVFHQENQGQAAARNLALAQAKGSWVCFVDSDDAIHPQMLELLHSAAVKADCGISMCAMVEGVSPPEDFSARKSPDFTVESMEEDNLTALYDADRYPGWLACGKLLRREIVMAYLFTPGRIFEDNEAVCRWICRAGAIAMVPQALYFYRRNPGSTTQTGYSLKKLDYLWALESILAYYASMDYGKMACRFFDRYVDAVVSACNGLQHTLGRRDLAETVERDCRHFARKQGMKLSAGHREALIDAMHPKLAKVYWPVAGALRTLRRQGVAGLADKLRKHRRGGIE